MATAEPSVQEENKALVRRYLEEIYPGISISSTRSSARNTSQTARRVQTT